MDPAGTLSVPRIAVPGHSHYSSDLEGGQETFDPRDVGSWTKGRSATPGPHRVIGRTHAQLFLGRFEFAFKVYGDMIH